MSGVSPTGNRSDGWLAVPLHRGARLAIGGLAGFVGALLTMTAVDRFGDDPLRVRAELNVLGTLDLEGYCSRNDSNYAAARIDDGALGWLCAGRINGVFDSIPIDPQDACEWQFDANAEPFLFDENSSDGWWCIEAEEG